MTTTRQHKLVEAEQDAQKHREFMVALVNDLKALESMLAEGFFESNARRIGAEQEMFIIDSAGRLHTQADLMQEISKVERVVARKLPGAPHETLLVLDATVGQNAVAQTRIFSQALQLSGLVLAKLDSSARGGVVVALKQEFGLPVKLVGTGEQIGDIEEFDAAAFAEEVLSA